MKLFCLGKTNSQHLLHKAIIFIYASSTLTIKRTLQNEAVLFRQYRHWLKTCLAKKLFRLFRQAQHGLPDHPLVPLRRCAVGQSSGYIDNGYSVVQK